MANKLKLVIDTNALLVSISRRSEWHWLYEAIINKKAEVFITNEILAEYEEKIGTLWSAEVAEAVIRTLIELSNVYLISTYYRLRLIVADEVDKKFSDCAFAANADFIITNDKHFNVLKDLNFPSIQIVRLEEFKELFLIQKKNINYEESF